MSDLDNELRLASDFRDKAEQFVFKHQGFPPGDRNTPLMAYWSLVLEFHRAIVTLISSKLYGAAFALLRPTLEATIRAHLVLIVSDETVKRILEDEYRTNFGTVGKEIDDAFGMETLFQDFLNGAKDALHGYTHIGLHQLGRRFTGEKLKPNYSTGEITELIHTSTSAVFMINNIVLKRLGLEEDWSKNTTLFDEWSKASENP